MYDVVIVGGSFAGLATAMQLRGYQVLLIEQYPIGTHQMSACGTPLATARAVGAECAIQDSHDALVLHTDGREIRFPLPDPYATFDYQAFCQAMLAQTNAEVWQARATDFVAGGVATTRGTVQARFIVDATGWRALRSRGADPAPGPLHVGYGLETELPIRLDLSPGLHFYVEKHIMRSGYGWVFPCRATTRFGIGAFEQGGSWGACWISSWRGSVCAPARPTAACWRSAGALRWLARCSSSATRPASACRRAARASAPRSSTASTAAAPSPPPCGARSQQTRLVRSTGSRRAAPTASMAGC